MPLIEVNGASIYCEVVGERGPVVVVQDPLFPISDNLYSGIMAGRIAIPRMSSAS